MKTQNSFISLAQHKPHQTQHIQFPKDDESATSNNNKVIDPRTIIYHFHSSNLDIFSIVFYK